MFLHVVLGLGKSSPFWRRLSRPLVRRCFSSALPPATCASPKRSCQFGLITASTSSMAFLGITGAASKSLMTHVDRSLIPPPWSARYLRTDWPLHADIFGCVFLLWPRL